ncbi:hypothetical protein Tsubulata_017526 [Turnera subulata]|uniref:Uncharacterized protein n=1 Tax=Turnera subulata TaxID=218843 RepID=A0A9Q0J8S6_9ROSI|nr:hypothetical protein Tsubulata_017526 [Turnera subulata]
MKRRSLHHSKHPFDDHPFETICHGSWQTVALINISDGALNLKFADSQAGVMEVKDAFPDIRIRSRPATLFDCTCFLRTGIDVCVLLSDRENSEPVWLDAMISSIERKPHESGCSCQFFVKFYVNQGCFVSETRPLKKETQVVGLNQISILQGLPYNPCEDHFYRWDYSEDCFSQQKSNKFTQDIMWLLVASVMKQIAFDVTSARNKIIYQVLGVDDDLCSSSRGSYNALSCVNFKVENGALTPTVVKFVLTDEIEVVHDDVPGPDSSASYDVTNLRRSKRRNVLPERFVGEITGNWQVRAWPRKLPKWKDGDLYIPLSQLFAIPLDSSCKEKKTWSQICSSEVECAEDLFVSNTKTRQWKVKSGVCSKNSHHIHLSSFSVPTEGNHAASEQSLSAAKIPAKHSEESTHDKINSGLMTDGRPGKITPEILTSKIPRKGLGGSTSKKLSCPVKSPQKNSQEVTGISSAYYSTGCAPAEKKIIESEDTVHESPVSKTKSDVELEATVHESPASKRKIDVELEDTVHESPGSKRKIDVELEATVRESPASKTKIDVELEATVRESPASKRKIDVELEATVRERPASKTKIDVELEATVRESPASKRKIDVELEATVRERPASKTKIDVELEATVRESPASKTKIDVELEDMVRESPASKMKIDVELEDKVHVQEGEAFIQNVKSSYRKKTFKKGRFCPFNFRRNDSFPRMPYKTGSLSEGALNKIINAHMKSIDSKLKSEDAPSAIDQWKELKAKKCSERQEQMKPSASEDEKESPEIQMLWREMELCLASARLVEENEVKISTETAKTMSKPCKHEFKLDEEIGILCSKCGFVKTEIKYVTSPFYERTSQTVENKPHNENSGKKPDEDEGLNLSTQQTIHEEVPLAEKSDTVWDLIPEFRMKLHAHQKKAFEFLWRNIAGSVVPELIEKESVKIGGCVVSHTPGAGKTFLIISFLVSYLKLFPGKRPLVLAPKTALCTWDKEFKKWGISIPVHLLHARNSYKHFKQRSGIVGKCSKTREDVMHVLDSLEKIQRWHAQPSVLVMGYSSFMSLTREGSRFSYRKYMAKVLRETPGILILDEGHNPRGTKSRLRKGLMKVETDLRILLSGTLFQNNFYEYFNTLCLARPKFIKEVTEKFASKRKREGIKRAARLSESRARKLFIDNIASKIDSNNTEERRQGVKMLQEITNPFVDMYERGPSDMLPGLQIYTITMNLTREQREILMKLQKLMETYGRVGIEVCHLITLAGIHPWLITTSSGVNKFYIPEELKEVDKLKSDARHGFKVMFVLNLVCRVANKEKVLVFCHYIAPIKLFLELFETVFGWEQGKEVLVLSGELELFERGRVMDQFEESSVSRVLLASTTASAEGVSLTAASRVIMLDPEWNPSRTKQAIARAFRPGQQRVVYVYQLLAIDTVEENKYRRKTWKEWVSSMIFREADAQDTLPWHAEEIEDSLLREMVEADRAKSVKSFSKIVKNEKASTLSFPEIR